MKQSTQTNNSNGSFLQLLNPVNKLEEKRKFLFDTLYNPQFEYVRDIQEEELKKYGVVSEEYLGQAISILEAVIKRWGTESEFLEENEGKVLTREELLKVVRAYLKENNIEGKVRIQFLQNAVSPASMFGNTLNIRIPISQREKRLIGTLNHEIGTHYFRRINEEKQPWAKQRASYKLRPYIETEEGLAALHSILTLSEPFLWYPALYYYMVYCAKKMSFSALNAEMRKYVDNRERRWNMCVRVKRGERDTSTPGAFSKDQAYLIGVNKMIRWLVAHDYDPRPLYIGKIAAEDIEKVQELNVGYTPVLPVFLQSDPNVYKEKIQGIIRANMLIKTQEFIKKPIEAER